MNIHLKKAFKCIKDIILELIFLFGSAFLIKVFLLKPLLNSLGLSVWTSKTIQGLLTLAMLGYGYFLVMSIYEKRKVNELSKKHFFKEGGFGFLAGFGFLSINVIFFLVLGNYRIIGVEIPNTILYGLVWVFMLATLEEFLFRGILFRVMEKSYGTWLAMLFSSLMFGVLHISNEHATWTSVLSATLGGGIVSLLFSVTGRLWVPIFYHFGWNIAQIFWGSPLSGMSDFGQIMTLETKGPNWLLGGEFGIENSLPCLMLSAFVFYICVKIKLNSSKISRAKQTTPMDVKPLHEPSIE